MADTCHPIHLEPATSYTLVNLCLASLVYNEAGYTMWKTAIITMTTYEKRSNSANTKVLGKPLNRTEPDGPATGVAEQGEQGEQLLPQLYQWGSSTPPTSHRHYFIYTEQPKSIIYTCCVELTVNANLLQSEFAQSSQQSSLHVLLHEQPF